MDSALLSTLPLLCILASFVYAAWVGIKVHRSTGQLSILGVAITLAGLSAGRLLNRFLPPAPTLDDSVNYRSLKVEVALLFMLAAAVAFFAVTLLKRESMVRSMPPLDPRRGCLLVALFVSAIAITTRGKIAAYLVYLLATVPNR
jgi:hypothetical protein